MKFIVKVWPNNAADAIPVKIVATVDEYFFKIVSTQLKTIQIKALHVVNTRMVYSCLWQHYSQ